MYGLHVMSITAERCVINMQALPADCWACGADASGMECGIPVYEDLILPNDWTGEWGGVPACHACFERQGKLTEPMTKAQWRR
jgi:hypothetical protein